MPKIRSDKLKDHGPAIWSALTDGLERLLGEMPYEQITLADIAATAGIARNTIYNYAKDKPTLLAKAAAVSSRHLLDRIIGIAAGHQPAPDRIAAIFETILSWFASADHRQLVLHTLFEPVDAKSPAIVGSPLMKIHEPVLYVLNDGVRTGHFRSLEDADFVVHLMAGMVQQAALRVVRAPEKLETTTRDFLALVFAGLNPAR